MSERTANKKYSHPRNKFHLNHRQQLFSLAQSFSSQSIHFPDRKFHFSGKLCGNFSGEVPCTCTESANPATAHPWLLFPEVLASSSHPLFEQVPYGNLREALSERKEKDRN